MKRYVIFFILFNSFVLHGMAQWDTCRTAELHKAYNRLKSDTTQKAQEEFFWAFPRNWNEYLIMDYEVGNRNEENIYDYVEVFGDLLPLTTPHIAPNSFLLSGELTMMPMAPITCAVYYMG